MGLKLTLKPGERAVINGAVIVNGDRRSSFLVENMANVLREADIMQPEEAITPAKRIYLPIMMMLIEQGRQRELVKEFETRLKQFADAIYDIEALQICASLAAKVANCEYYKALALCRKLIAFEKTRLSNVA